MHWHLSIQSKSWSLSLLSSPMPPRQGCVTLSHDVSRCGVTAAALETELIIMCNAESHASQTSLTISLPVSLSSPPFFLGSQMTVYRFRNGCPYTKRHPRFESCRARGRAHRHGRSISTLLLRLRATQTCPSVWPDEKRPYL